MDQRYEAARAYVAAHCIPERALAARAGLDAAQLMALEAAGVVPKPTYRVGPSSVISAIRALGQREAGAAGWYGVSVAAWLRRAAVLAEATPAADLADAMADGVARDLVTTLGGAAADAQAFGWGGLFRDGRCDLTAARAYVDGEWAGWMAGGWAVCLRRFDGHHLAVKEIERQRIGAMLAAGVETPAERLALADAMARLDAVLLPFAPHERPHGTPGKFLDEPARRLGLPWDAPYEAGTTGSSIDEAVSPVR